MFHVHTPYRNRKGYKIDVVNIAASLTTFDFVGLVTAGPSVGAMRGQPVSVNTPDLSHGPESLQQMKKLMKQELKNDKANSNKGYVFTLMPLYAIGVGMFAAYKFLKVKQVQRMRMRRHF